MLVGRGYAVVDADQVARHVVTPGSKTLTALVARFGEEILSGDASLDRRELGRRVFGKPEEKRALEQIMHPAIALESAARFQRLSADGHELVFYEAALLVETGRWKSMHALIVVSAAPSTQLARIMARDTDLSEAEAKARIASQMSAAERERVATFIIRNDAELADLEAQIDEVLGRLNEVTHG